MQVIDASKHASLGYVARTVSLDVTRLLGLQGSVLVQCRITHATVRHWHNPHALDVY